MSLPRSDSSFRPDIEGLRALAVLLVVACHARVPGLQGGFIGVDVFFVISGYLITRLLLGEWQREGRLDIAGFYVRRLRRLLPAFALMLGFVIAATWFLYAPTEQVFHLQRAVAATLYFSNIHYALQSTDYMAPSAKLDPLLHTWSLGVEEQFYLVWPLLLLLAGLLARHTGRQWLPAVLVIAGLTSFAACILLTQSRQPLAFFLPVTRAWEFCLGAALVLLEGRVVLRASVVEVVAAAALLALPGAALLLSPKTPFPGAVALVPALGTALLILLVPRLAPGNLPLRVLALAPMQWMGRLSYGWYLWHWPLLVFGREVFPGQGLPGDLLIAGIALLLAQASYTFVEHPVRTSPRFGHRFVARGAFALTALSLAGITLISSQAVELSESERFQRYHAVKADYPSIYNFKCDGWFYDSQLRECPGGAQDGHKTAVLLGDSHAGQWYSAVHEVMRHSGWRLVVMTKSACPIVDEEYFYERIGRTFTECGEWRRNAVERIRALRPELVIVASASDYPLPPEAWAAGTGRILADLADSTAGIFILRDTPAPGFNAPGCLARREWNPSLAPANCTFDYHNAHADQVMKALEQAARPYPNAHIIDLTRVVCDQNPCDVSTAGTIKYRDGHHLTDSYVRSLAPHLRSRLREAGAVGL
jgi:peptidoglycan/LPS O-acetylase OafA/YrhL